MPSAPVFPQDDPTLLFTNAGMNQFKDVFLGTGTRDYTRAADTQKCIRVSGKHNDLEEVGRDTYHHTFFEMLGNWSFGDYFKEDAIAWAWELLTEVWELPKERLWVTVFGGDRADGCPPTTRPRASGSTQPGLDRTRVLRFGKKDNFWEMGETGPCGPCTEIHIDRGGPGTDPADGADRKIGVNAGNERFMELWNLVFIAVQPPGGRLARAASGAARRHRHGLRAHPRRCSRARARTTTRTSSRRSSTRIAEIAGKRYGKRASEADVAFRVVADHVRAVTAPSPTARCPRTTAAATCCGA